MQEKIKELIKTCHTLEGWPEDYVLEALCNKMDELNLTKEDLDNYF